jgi:hypothetical protein
MDQTLSGISQWLTNRGITHQYLDYRDVQHWEGIRIGDEPWLDISRPLDGIVNVGLWLVDEDEPLPPDQSWRLDPSDPRFFDELAAIVEANLAKEG